MEYFKNPLVLLAIYGTAVFFLTLFTRKIVETWNPDLKRQSDVNDPKKTYLSSAARWWNEVILYSLGPFFGVVLSFSMVTSEYFPDMFKGNWIVTAMAGLCVGFSCGWVYKLSKKFLARAMMIDETELDKSTDAPEPPGGA
jgi:hypothetical protein